MCGGERGGDGGGGAVTGCTVEFAEELATNAQGIIFVLYIYN